MKNITGIILAGTSGSITDRSTWITSNGTFLENTIKALSDLDEIILVSKHTSIEGVRTVPPGTTFLESVLAGLGASVNDQLLYITIDMPFIHKEAVNGFIDECLKASTLQDSICYPIVKLGKELDRFPPIPRTSIKIKEGVYTGGNLALVSKENLKKSFPLIEQAYQNRKSPLALAKMAGVEMLSRLIFSKIYPSILSQSYIEKKTSSILGTQTKLIPTKYTEIGIDVDNLEQYRIYLDHMGLKQTI